MKHYIIIFTMIFLMAFTLIITGCKNKNNLSADKSSSLNNSSSVLLSSFEPNNSSNTSKVASTQSGKSFSAASSSTSDNTVIEELNTASFMDTDGKFIYYTDVDGIYKSNINGKNTEVILSGINGGSLTVHNNYIYYLDANYTLNRMNKDGKNTIKYPLPVEIKNYSSIYCIDDILYARCNNADSNSDKKTLRLVGSIKGDPSTIKFSVVDFELQSKNNRKYILKKANDANHGILYSYDINNSDEKKILNEEIKEPFIKGEYIFYQPYEKKELWMIGINGNNQRKICDTSDINSFFMDYSVEWLYYYTWKDKDIYRVNISTGEKQLFPKSLSSVIMIGSFTVYNGNIYFLRNMSLKFSKVKMDGTGEILTSPFN